MNISSFVKHIFLGTGITQAYKHTDNKETVIKGAQQVIFSYHYTILSTVIGLYRIIVDDYQVSRLLQYTSTISLTEQSASKNPKNEQQTKKAK